MLVTGHTGFKGSWLSIWLHMLGARVTGYALPPDHEPSLFEHCELGRYVDDVVGDIRDVDELERVLRETRPALVFHLAAQPLVRRSYREPLDTLSTNVMGTAHVLEGMRGVDSIRGGVFVTSDKCYENREWNYAYRERDALGGWDPYSASKGAAEIVIASYRRSFFEQEGAPVIASARAGNVIGGGDWSEDRIIPDCARALATGYPLSVRHPTAVRPWQHVLEPLAGYLILGSQILRGNRAVGDAWNFGPAPEDADSVAAVVEAFMDRWGTGEWIACSPAGEAAVHEAGTLRLDCTRAHCQLQWRPVYELTHAISETADWYREFYMGNRFNALEYSCRQIERYVDRAKAMGIPWASDNGQR